MRQQCITGKEKQVRPNPRQYDVVSAFFARIRKPVRASSMSYEPGGPGEDDYVYSYSTAIMQRMPDGRTIGNVTGYSRSTTTHQNAIGAKYADILVKGVPRGTRDLRRYMKLNPLYTFSTKYGAKGLTRADTAAEAKKLTRQDLEKIYMRGGQGLEVKPATETDLAYFKSKGIVPNPKRKSKASKKTQSSGMLLILAIGAGLYYWSKNQQGGQIYG